MVAGDEGPIVKWAIDSQISVGRFFGAERFVPVTNAHMMGDIEVLGDAGASFLRGLADQGGAVRVPTTTNARCIDFDRADRLRQDPEMVVKEAAIMQSLRQLGITLTDTCINYQTVYQPAREEHLAWGDTGTVIYANSVFGARSNFESGPAALAAGLTGRTPAYGFHLDEARRGTFRVRVEADLVDITDWGVVGALVGAHTSDYFAVPVFECAGPPRGDSLKHLGASLASYGSFGMFHMVRVTPEAPDVDAAFHGQAPAPSLVIGESDLAAFYDRYPAGGRADVVVMTGPQLSVFELARAAELIRGEQVAEGTTFIITTNAQNRAAAAQLGYLETLERAGAVVLSGVCFYLMAVNEMREAFAWETLVTNSAKVANIVGGYRLRPSLRRTEQCVESAVTGVIAGA